MSRQEPRYYNKTMGPPGRRLTPQNSQRMFPPVDFLHREIQRLGSLLDVERARRFEDNQKLADMQAELEETNVQLRRQKALKEMFINRGKETKRELERAEKFSDPGALDGIILATQVHEDVKHKRKKMLQKDFEELKVTHLLSQKALSSQIQAEKDKSKALQEELDKVQTFYKKLLSKHEGETQTLCEEQQLLEELRAEKDDMFQKVSEKIAFLQNSFQEELNQMKLSYRELDCPYNKDVSGMKQNVETCRQEVRCEEDAANLGNANETLQLNNVTTEKEDDVQNMSEEITILQTREKEMQNKLHQVQISYQKLKSKYETDVTELQQQVEEYCQKIKLKKIASSKREKEFKNQVETYREEADREKKANLERAEKDLQQINTLRAEKEQLCEEMSNEIEILQQKFIGITKHLKCNMGQCEANHSALQQQVENLQLQIVQEKKAHLEKSRQDMALLNEVRAVNAALQETTTKEIKFLEEKEKNARTELEKVKRLYQELSYRYDKDVAALKQEHPV
ncbi:myosin heavy chain, muscle-like [Poecilia reticulata]|uniref:myosin heavy chain, muscle-like n=1 Tax=Poecilia reticulata TaxID=8081 RepID=UPI0004A4BEE5|nr:PREDICTED: myosin heavy chain, muscle-like [Poecilia reticulata]